MATPSVYIETTVISYRIVSWNCTHIASARVRRIMGSINDTLDIRTPITCTPEELMEV